MPIITIELNETQAAQLMKRFGWSGTLAGHVETLVKEVLDRKAVKAGIDRNAVNGSVVGLEE